MTNTVLSILTVLLDEVGNVELLFRSGKRVLSTKGFVLLASENKGLELKGNLSKHWLCSSLIPYFLTSKLIQVCSISGSQSKGKNSWRWFTHKWNAQNQSGYLSLLPFFLCIWILSLYFPPFLLSLLSSVGAAVSTVVPLEMPAVLN